MVLSLFLMDDEIFYFFVLFLFHDTSAVERLHHGITYLCQLIERDDAFLSLRVLTNGLAACVMWSISD